MTPMSSEWVLYREPQPMRRISGVWSAEDLTLNLDFWNCRKKRRNRKWNAVELNQFWRPGTARRGAGQYRAPNLRLSEQFSYGSSSGRSSLFLVCFVGMTAGELAPAARRLGRAIGKREAVEKLWREFFADPSQWWDQRADKVDVGSCTTTRVSSRYPDFKHKKTEAALWLDGRSNPNWVKPQLAAMAPGKVQSDIFSWNRRLNRHLEAGDYKKAVDSFHQMQEEGTLPDRSVFLRVLKASAALGALDEGRRVHEQIVQHGCASDVYVGSSLVDMYAKCGSIEESRTIFNKMPTRSVVTWNTMIQGYVKCSLAHKALTLFQQMQEEGVEPDNVTFVGVLNACSAIGVGALEEGRHVHDRIVRTGRKLDVNVENSLIDMYAKCGSVADARKTFDSMPARNVVSWNTMISGYVKCGEGQMAVDLSQQMPLEGVKPDLVTYLALLNACANTKALEKGRRVHEDLIRGGFESDVFIASSLIDMYAKCGSPEEARRVFDTTPHRNVVPWNAMISGYVRCGEARKALDLSLAMPIEGVKPDSVTCIALLVACGRVRALDEGRRLHKQIIQGTYEGDTSIGNSLVDMYAKCGSLQEARSAFDQMSRRSVASWNIMIQGCVRCGENRTAVDVFGRMQREGDVPNSNTFACVLNALASVGTLQEGKRLHKRIIEDGCESDVLVGNGLVYMYSKCGSTTNALRVFCRMPTRNSVSWNSLMLGYAKCGQGEKVLELWRRRKEEGMAPDAVSFVAMLSACGSTRAVEEGKRIHELMIEGGCVSEGFVGSSLVNMYAKCRSMADAWGVFDSMAIRSVATWNAMIMGCASCGEERRALELFQQMRDDDVKPDPVTFVGLLKACGRPGIVEDGRRLHEHIVQSGLESDISVGNGLIDLYGRCGSLEEARKVFDKMPRRNVHSWNNIILEYSRRGDEKSALGLSERMRREGESHSFSWWLNVSPDDGALQEGMSVHEQIMLRGCESDVFMGRSMVDMYGKGGGLENAQRGALNRTSTASRVVP